MSTHRSGIASGAALVALVLLQLGTSPAVAADEPVVIEFSEPTSLTLEYGQYWSFPLTADNDFVWELYAPQHYEINSTGVRSGYAPTLNIFNQTGANNGILLAPYDVAPLIAGNYSFTINGTFDDGANTWHGETPIPAGLTVTPAQLGLELRVITDPNNVAAAVISTKFTGRFVDEFAPSNTPGAALSPAGSWKVILKDSEGTTALEHTIDRAAGDDTLATSFYWAGAKPGTVYTATATFTPSGTSAANFQVAPATAFSYTAGDASRPVPTSTATVIPVDTLPDAAPLSLPLWLVILLGIATAGLIALVVVLALKIHNTQAVGKAVHGVE